ncbi:hypothetical protein ACIQMP_07865 [Streptomyces sp. NPDC091385]|uniref:hypothetical protein n=1 Tax=Streptomyces sp. NPDC091385 TaxID=3365997 RepID=UPI0037F1BE8B
MPESTDVPNPDPAPALALATVRAALGFSTDWTPRTDIGESATHVILWSQLELNDLYERLGRPGPVALRLAEPVDSLPVLELAFTVLVDGVGPVEASAEWCPTLGGHDTPLLRAATSAVHQLAC